jgi:hypothetical protein
MNIYDAAKILGLSGEVTPELAKAAYHAACKKYHPDVNPAGEDMMKVVNEAYSALRDFSGSVKEQQTDYSDLLNNALNAILGLSALSVEICGVWVWVTGDTRAHKDALKAAGYRWSGQKEAWYFRPEQFRSRGRGVASMEEIRGKYGSKWPRGKGRTLLQAGGQAHA